VPLTLTAMVSVRSGAEREPAKDMVALPAILVTVTLAGAQVSVEPDGTAIEGAIVKLAPDGAVQE